jgi:Zn-dependent M32 family carboxypeptidase
MSTGPGRLRIFSHLRARQPYGAQIWRTLCSDFGGEATVDELLRRGDLRTIGSWLNEHIYRYGLLYRPGRLLEQVCGRPLDAGCYKSYLVEKYRQLYGF